jgi:dGTPase
MIFTKNEENVLYSQKDFERKIASPTEKARHSVRDDFERDYGRVVHSAAFRRLQGKTQVIGIDEGDFHRTRLTHSMEVAQIARGICILLNSKFKEEMEYGQVDTSLIETAALAHDLGHPPFGHKGERALHKKMIEKGLGFEGNAQTFRILTSLEGKKSGLNLTRASLLSILKYPVTISEADNPKYYSINSDYKPPKASIYLEDRETFNWLLECFTEDEKTLFTSLNKKEYSHHKTRFKTFECSIIELADDIAYATHDLQDGVKLRLIDIGELKTLLSNYSNSNKDMLVKLINKIESLDRNDTQFTEKLKDFFADLIHFFIINIKVIKRSEFESNRLKYFAELPVEIKKLIEELNLLTYENIISTHRVQTLEWKGGEIVSKLFDAMFNNKSLLPKYEQTLCSNEQPEVNARIVCDYIAGMTDSYALKMYARLFESKGGRLFDI